MAGSTRPWGWHELDARWAARLVADADLPRRSLVIDIGAGTGAITAPLHAAGHRVIAVEAHPERARFLRDRFADRGVIVVHADATALRLPRQPYHVVANPPFAITSALLRLLLQPGSRLQTAHLVVQQRAAIRWQQPDAPGAGRWSREFHVVLGQSIPRRSFTPAPTVDCRVLTIRRR